MITTILVTAVQVAIVLVAYWRGYNAGFLDGQRDIMQFHTRKK